MLLIQNSASERMLLEKYQEVNATKEFSMYLDAMNVSRLSKVQIKKMFHDMVNDKRLEVLVRQFEKDGFVVIQDDTENFLVKNGNSFKEWYKDM